MIDLAQLPIFPCNLAKEPLSVHGFKSARRGAKWKHWPLVGFPTGAASGIDVFDIDPTGVKWFDANFDALPSTRAHETQRGLHLLFAHAPGLRCSTNKIAEGIDIRADGGSDPKYADDADIIQRKWHSVEPKHGGAFWRELSRRKIRLGKWDNVRAEVPNVEARTKLSAFVPSRNPDARLNHISAKISENPTERTLFSWSCLAAEIVHECKLKPSHVMNLIAGNAYPALHKTLGKEGIRRTISNAFRHVEEKYLAEEET